MEVLVAGAMRTCSQPSRRKTGQSTPDNQGAASSTAKDERGANFFEAKPTAKRPMNMMDGREKSTEWSGSV
jgi:hypothetical protein